MKKKIIPGILAIIVALAGFTGYKLFNPSVSNKQDAYFYIKTGDGLATVKESLIAGQFIKGNNFDIVCKLLKYKKPKPGRYKLKDGMSLYKLVKLLRSGNQAEVKMVINK